MKKNLLILCLPLFIHHLLLAQSWEVVGEDAFIDYYTNNIRPVDDTTLAIDHTGVPYLAFLAAAYNNNYCAGIAKKFENSSWEYVGGETFDSQISTSMNTGYHMSSSMVFDSNNIPYVAYIRYGGRVKVTTLIDGMWQNIGPENTISNGSPAYSMAIDQNDNLYLFYNHVYSLDSTVTLVKKFENNSWQTVGEEGFSINQVRHTSMVVDSNNVPYIAYIDLGIGSTIQVKKLENESWINVGDAMDMDPSDHTIWSNALFMDSNDTPYIATYIRMYSDPISFKMSFRKLIDNQWVLVSELLFNGDFNMNVGIHTASAALYHDVPYVAYSDPENNHKATVKKYDNGTWQTVGQAGFSQDGIASVHLAISNQGVFYVTYKDGSNWSFHHTVMKYDNSMNIDEHTDSNILLYPNPANQVVTITNIPTDSTIKLYDSLGKQVYSTQASQQITIDTAGFSAGIYVVKVVDAQRRQMVKKFVVSRRN